MMTQIEKVRLLASIIAELESKHDGVAPLSDVKSTAKDNGIGEEFVKEFVRREKAEGRMYSPTEGGIKMTANIPFVEV